MFFSNRMRHRLKWIGLLMVGCMLLSGALGYFWPLSGKTPLYSAAAWAFGVVAVVMIWGVLETLGSAFMSLGFWNGIPSILRVGLLVVLVAGVTTALLVWLA